MKRAAGSVFERAVSSLRMRRGEAVDRSRRIGGKLRRLLRQRRSTESLAQRAAERREIVARERNEHDGQWVDGELVQEPSEDSRIDAAVLLKDQREIGLRCEPGAVQEEEIDEVTWLGAREDLRELRGAEIGE
ncbi:MAG: hypothetical protein KIT84_28840 [Labilithrix sp.]|nr:hypothetical protein [Labilithrix sp.]MCW5815068.1 hypothetical protein [Labilithrix sp.]